MISYQLESLWRVELMPSVLGLTGNIASGKTTIGLMLLELGATEYVDADAVVHELYLPGRPLTAKLAETFGPSILDSDGGVDRRVLGQIVFGDTAKLRLLESLVHPEVQMALIGRMRRLPPDGVGVLDAVKLVESGYASLCHGLWVVTCPPETQLQRLIETRGLSEAEARLRLNAQPPIEPKRAVATEVIDNSGSLDDLRRQVNAAWARYLASLG
jgi:dephospho-CoA kinase